ncbi:hypothetical protein sscle_02g020110 [Sclerotinia sclerotiorum 1980 UF-70]|uniref:Uncharacterized protein n=1 Tax=Sclerotinia sclerotiorum (strain ATCC 18683 / 1980 / Ss-1) TaxID=665079 RepID=A0A1D9PX19_SCLS1|nr:hypothetical protein sscle_02g020110 [Sclerotinia sclerotiorum 1980 UF-70]
MSTESFPISSMSNTLFTRSSSATPSWPSEATQKTTMMMTTKYPSILPMPGGIYNGLNSHFPMQTIEHKSIGTNETRLEPWASAGKSQTQSPGLLLDSEWSMSR